MLCASTRPAELSTSTICLSEGTASDSTLPFPSMPGQIFLNSSALFLGGFLLKFVSVPMIK